MKRILIIVLAGLLALGMSTASFAQGKKHAGHKAAASAGDVFQGKIVSINAAGDEIVVKNKKTGEDRTVSVKSDAISSLKVGDRVRVKAKDNSPADVQVIKGKNKGKK